ncbi:EamA family transporter [bacterium]|nr:EamA family transporter [bacterium]
MNTSRATLLGVLAILFWGTMVAMSRRLTEHLGAFTTGASICTGAGIAGTAFLAVSGRISSLRALRPAYVLGCGALLVLYMVLIYWAVGGAASRQEIVGVTVANYLWPGLTLVFSLPLLNYRARVAPLLLGMAACTCGVALAALDGTPASRDGMTAGVRHGVVIAAAAAAAAWALYSNLSRRWAHNAGVSAVPLFLLAAGVCFLCLRLAFPEQSHWSISIILAAAYVAFCPTLLAYVFWDIGMRQGSVAMLAVLAYTIPVLSLLTSRLCLGITLRPVHWAGCALVIAGAALCRASVRCPARPEGDTQQVLEHP